MCWLRPMAARRHQDRSRMFLCATLAQALRQAARRRHQSYHSDSIAIPPTATLFLHRSARTDATWRSCPQPQIWSIATPTAWPMYSCGIRVPGRRPVAHLPRNACLSLQMERRATKRVRQGQLAPPGATSPSVRQRQISIPLLRPAPPEYFCETRALERRPAARLRHSK